MSAPENPPAFPFPEIRDADGCGILQGSTGMTLRDWFAGTLPEPSSDAIAIQESFDRSRNPYNEGHKPRLRSRDEIVAYLRYRAADALLSERAKNTGEA